MPQLLQAPLPDERKDLVLRRIQEIAFLGVSTQNVNLLSDTVLLSACCNHDPAKLASALAISSSAGGLIEFLVNPVLGKMTDDYGRKWTFYVGPGFAGIGMSLLVLLTEGKNLPILLVHKAFGWALCSMSVTFAGTITLSDMYSGSELGMKTAKMFGALGLAIVAAPTFGAMVLRRTGNAMNVYRIRLLLALVQLLHAWKTIPETLTVDRRRKFRISDVNPFSFLKLFTTKSTTLRTLTAMLFFHSFAEGKNLSSLMQSWMASPLKWPVQKNSAHTSAFGFLAFSTGIYVVQPLIKRLGPRGFTSLTNRLNALGLTWMGLPLPTYDSAFCLGLAVHGPGVNNTSAAAVKAMACDHALANGFSRGEYGGMASACRTFTLFLAPILYGWLYRTSIGSKTGIVARYPGFPFFVAAVIGAVIPEILHCSLSDDELTIKAAPQVDEGSASAQVEKTQK